MHLINELLGSAQRGEAVACRFAVAQGVVWLLICLAFAGGMLCVVCVVFGMSWK